MVHTIIWVGHDNKTYIKVNNKYIFIHFETIL